MAQTVIPANHPMARKLYSVATFAMMERAPSMSRLLRGPAPTEAQANSKLKGQSSPDYPIVEITDLRKTAGDEVSVDLYHTIGGKPTMGDRKLSTTGSANLSFASMDVSIDQYRRRVDAGGKMTQQRTLHNLRAVAQANLVGYFNRLKDELAMVHLAGARGFQAGSDWIVPLESDEDFDAIAVNDVLPPSPNRRFFAGDATSVNNIDNADILKLSDIDKMRARIDEMAHPPQPIRLAGDPAADDEPLYLMLVTGRQWYQILTNTDSQNWRTFLANAYERGRFTNHPLFMGTAGMWNGILIKKIRRCVRFTAGSAVREYASDGSTINNTTAGSVDVDRALILGAQALGIAYGRDARSDFYMSWFEEMTDAGNDLEITGSTMAGVSKLKFKDKDGTPTDHGVLTLDSAAPAIS